MRTPSPSPWLAVALLALALGTAAVGCPPEPPPGGDGGGPPSDTAGDAPSHDVGDTLGDTGPAGEFVLGTNVTGRNTHDFFTELDDGDSLAIEFGSQGLWMVVLAFKTRGLLDGKLFIDGRISADGAELGRLALKDRQLAVGPDGWFYFYNFYLVVTGPEAAGLEADVRMDVTDARGVHVVVDRRVSLTGGVR